jgi:hypothetical protein
VKHPRLFSLARSSPCPNEYPFVSCQSKFVLRSLSYGPEFLTEMTCLMKNPFDVLSMKEQELLKVKLEAEALRVTARLLDDPTDWQDDHTDWERDPKKEIFLSAS